MAAATAPLLVRMTEMVTPEERDRVVTPYVEAWEDATRAAFSSGILPTPLHVHARTAAVFGSKHGCAAGVVAEEMLRDEAVEAAQTRAAENTLALDAQVRQLQGFLRAREEERARDAAQQHAAKLKRLADALDDKDGDEEGEEAVRMRRAFALVTDVLFGPADARGVYPGVFYAPTSPADDDDDLS